MSVLTLALTALNTPRVKTHLEATGVFVIMGTHLVVISVSGTEVRCISAKHMFKKIIYIIIVFTEIH